MSPPPPQKKSELNVKYAIVGFSPYSLHYDLSVTDWIFRFPKYFFELNDLHHCIIDAGTIRKILRPEFIQKMEKKSLEKDFICMGHAGNGTIALNTALGVYGSMHAWDHKNYPDTVVENKKIFRDYLRLLEDNSIHPIIVLAPHIKEYTENFCRAKLDEIFEFLNDLRQDHSFTFINFWAKDLINMFDDHDFFDAVHLNRNGSKKFSAKLNEIIMNIERGK